MSAEAPIDVIVDRDRWIDDPRYRQDILRIARPPILWRFVCRPPQGGVELLASVSFMHNGRARLIKAANLWR